MATCPATRVFGFVRLEYNLPRSGYCLRLVLPSPTRIRSALAEFLGAWACDVCCGSFFTKANPFALCLGAIVRQTLCCRIGKRGRLFFVRRDVLASALLLRGVLQCSRQELERDN